jgi:hypothetical protein
MTVGIAVGRMRGAAGTFSRGIAAARFALLSLVTLALASCSFIPREPFTEREQAIAQIPGLPNVRMWADAGFEEFNRFLNRERLNGAIAAQGRFDMLALSGGGYDGAYGAGVVAGWTRTGTRPQFQIVTGVSAGALIAPLAFAGPDYDEVLERAFTGGVSQILGDMGVLSLLGSADIRRSNLVDVVAQFVDRPLLQRIAAEHAKGRFLLVVTTNLDAQRAVIWDMGAIAASGHPDALKLFTDVLVASASIPGVFAPALIEAEAQGRRFREMHVDGGVSTQVFIVPDVLLASGVRFSRPRNAPVAVWVVVNNRVAPQFEVIENGILPIASRSLSTLIKSDTRKTLLATASYVGKTNLKLTFIDDDGFKSYLGPEGEAAIKPGFNTAYMRAMFGYGARKMMSGRAWERGLPLSDGFRARMREIASSAR